MALKSEFAPDFFNYMLKNKQIAIFNECFYLNSFDPKFLVPKSELVFKNLISNFNKASKILRLIPGVKAFSLCNSLALKTFHKDSDVDLFIILDSKTFFTTRILIILVFTIFRLRPLVCLSFFVSERNLNLREIAMKKDYYLEFWCNSLNFITSDSALVQQFNVLNSSNAKVSQTFMYKKSFDFFESKLRDFQISRAKSKALKLMSNNGIVIKDGFLKFHHNDIRFSFNPLFALQYDEFLQGNRVKTFQQSQLAE